MDAKAYSLLNLLIVGITGAILLYAGFFVDTPGAIKCVYKQMTGINCPTCGLTRSFHALTKGHFQEGQAMSIYGVSLFAFFAFQLIGRITILTFSTVFKLPPLYYPKTDALISIMLFLTCFGGLILEQFG